MFGFIKKWFKKEEPKEEYYINFRKLRQKSMEDDFGYIMSNIKLYPGQTQLPATWLYHIEQCVKYGCIKTALNHIQFLSHFVPGTKIDLSPLMDMVENSIEYKQMKLNEKLERMKKDFE